MAKFAIPKTITFEKFGEKFANSELTFRAIPTDDYPSIDAETKKINEASPDEAMKIMNGILEKYFLSGTFYDSDSDSDLEVSKNDIGLFPSNVMLACFQTLTGIDRDPKDEQPSTK